MFEKREAGRQTRVDFSGTLPFVFRSVRLPPPTVHSRRELFGMDFFTLTGFEFNYVLDASTATGSSGSL